MVFENGVRLYIQMQDGQTADMEKLPPSDMMPWLKLKIERENKKEESEAFSENKPADGEKASMQDDEPPKEDLSQADAKSRALSPSEMNKTMNSGKSRAKSPAPEEATKEEPAPVAEEVKPEPAEEEKGEDDIIMEEPAELSDPKLELDGVDMTQGAKLTFTFNEGNLIVSILPNGDCMQKVIENKAMPKSKTKGNNLIENPVVENMIEQHRVITTNGEIIRHMADGNFIIYFVDGSLTYSDKRRGLWYTINPQGIKRVRRVKERVV